MAKTRDIVVGIVIGSVLTFTTFALAIGRFRFRAEIAGVEVGFV